MDCSHDGTKTGIGGCDQGLETKSRAEPTRPHRPQRSIHRSAVGRCSVIRGQKFFRSCGSKEHLLRNHVEDACMRSPSHWVSLHMCICIKPLQIRASGFRGYRPSRLDSLFQGMKMARGLGENISTRSLHSFNTKNDRYVLPLM